MRSLGDIVSAVRSGEPVDFDELRLAVVAFDVLLAQQGLQQHPAALQAYFEAAQLDPREYVGVNNDPDNEGAAVWYRAMLSVRVDP